MLDKTFPSANKEYTCLDVRIHLLDVCNMVTVCVPVSLRTQKKIGHLNMNALVIAQDWILGIRFIIKLEKIKPQILFSKASIII